MYSGAHGRAVFEILRVGRQLRHRFVELLVGNGDEALRRALGGARVAVDLDESVGEIHRRVVLHPGDAEPDPVAGISRLVVTDERGQYLVLPRLGIGARLLQVLVGLLQELRIPSRWDLAVGRAGAINLFHQLAVRSLHQPRVQGMRIVKVLQVRHADPRIEVVGAGLQDVERPLRALGRDRRLEIRVEQRRPQRFQFAVQIGLVADGAGAIGIAAKASAGERRGCRRLQILERKLGQKFLRGHLVVVAAIGPDELGEVLDFAPPQRVRGVGMPQDRFQQPLLPQSVNRVLIVIDRIDRDGRLSQPVGKRLLARRELLEALRFQLHEPGRPDAVYQRPVVGPSRGQRQNKNRQCSQVSAPCLYVSPPPRILDFPPTGPLPDESRSCPSTLPGPRPRFECHVPADRQRAATVSTYRVKFLPTLT